MPAQQLARRGDPVASHHDGPAEPQAQQARLVAGERGRGVGFDGQHAVAGAPVATRNDPGVVSLSQQQADDRHHRGRLAGAAHDEVADDDHRHRQGLRSQRAALNQQAPQRHQRAVECCHGPQRQRQRTARQPGSLQPLRCLLA